MSLHKCLTISFAEFAIMVLGIVALDHGLDGYIFLTTVGTIAGLGGYTAKQLTNNHHGKNT